MSIKYGDAACGLETAYDYSNGEHVPCMKGRNFVIITVCPQRLRRQEGSVFGFLQVFICIPHERSREVIERFGQG